MCESASLHDAQTPTIPMLQSTSCMLCLSLHWSVTLNPPTAAARVHYDSKLFTLRISSLVTIALPGHHNIYRAMVNVSSSRIQYDADSYLASLPTVCGMVGDFQGHYVWPSSSFLSSIRQKQMAHVAHSEWTSATHEDWTWLWTIFQSISAAAGLGVTLLFSNLNLLMNINALTRSQASDSVSDYSENV